MNRKVLNEVALAAAIGAVFGVVVAIVLVAEFGLAKWATLIVAGFAGALSGGVCYRPGEVGHVVVEICRQWKRNIVVGVKTMTITKPLTAVKDAVVAIASGVKNRRRTIFKWCYGILLAMAFITVSRFTVASWMPLDNSRTAPPRIIQLWVLGPIASLIVVMIAITVFGALFAHNRTRPSWWLPITTRISKCIDGWEDVGLPYGKWNTLHFLILGVITTFAPLLAMLTLSFSLVALAIDIVITLVLALASTERLASMAGALIGTVAGSMCYFHTPSYLPAIIVGALIGGLSGRWLYALRYALVYKDPKAAPA